MQNNMAYFLLHFIGIINLLEYTQSRLEIE